MKVISHPSPDDFWQAAGPLFTADPVRHTVAMTVLARLRAGGSFSAEQPILLTVEDDGQLVGAAFCTPPFPVNVSALPLELAPLLADYLAAHGVRPSGASGLRPETEAFTAAWTARTGAEPADHIDQRLYQLDQLAAPTGIEGEPVLATIEDLDLLVDWRVAFRDEADDHLSGERTRDSFVRSVRDSFAAGNANVLWRVDGQPVSLAAVNVPRSGMSRVGPVYTPKEFRNHGYGSAVTAAASRWALDNGAEHVVLFTDLSNPVSNSIYQRIGFVPVADALDVTFAPVRLP